MTRKELEQKIANLNRRMDDALEREREAIKFANMLHNRLTMLANEFGYFWRDDKPHKRDEQ